MEMSRSGQVSSALPAKPPQARVNKIYPDLPKTDADKIYQTTNTDSTKQRSGKSTRTEKTKMVAKPNPCDCENIPDDGCITKLPCYQKLHNSLKFKVFVFLLVFCLDAVDLISDWLLYSDVAKTERGLVYGPPEEALVWSLLAFSIVGSLTFTFEVINLWWEIFRNNPWIDSDLMSAITTWIEDVPQIALNVFIVACREEAISYFQLVKASVIIVSAIIRIIVSLIRYCSKRALCELHNARKNAKNRRHVTYRVFIMLGLMVTLAGSVTVFMFTQSERNPDGTLNFKVPHSVIVGEYDDEKYFHNVSIFLSHPLFDQHQTGDLKEDKINWIRMATIYDIRQTYEDGFFHVRYDNSTKNKIVLTLSDSQGADVSQDCFTFDHSSGLLTSQSNCNAFLPVGPNVIEFIFKFQFTEPKVPSLIFGDIKYNVAVKENAKCHGPSSSIYDDISRRLSDTNNAALHYFRTKTGVADDKHLLYTGSTPQYYRSDNLIDISEVWRTGFATCKSTGSMAPHSDSNINVPCA